VTDVPREALLLDVEDGEQLGVEVAGSGPPLVLLHGAGGNRATWWPQLARLAQHFRVVVVEARGSGRSTDRAEQTGPVAGARDLEAVRRHLDLPAWHVLGHSLGGWTALRYAATHPGSTRSVIAVSSVAGVFPPAVDEHWQQFTRRLAATPWPPNAALARPPSLPVVFCEAHPEQAVLYQLIGALNAPPSPRAPALRIREADLTPAELQALTMPVAFVVGGDDPIAPPSAVRAAADAVPGASYVELPGLGHLPFWEDPAGFAATVVDLLGG
jgi:pimeloyl-ACP methyl ester carboxylesterase